MSLVFTAQISGLVARGILASALGVRKVFTACAVLLVVLIAVGRIWMEPKDSVEPAQVQFNDSNHGLDISRQST